MDQQLISALPLDLPIERFGAPQRSGPLAVLPLFGPDLQGRYASPLSGLKLAGVQGYGNIELENHAGRGTAIVPLHIGYIQDRAQNHALCRSALLGEGQKLMFRDACCVQQTQGGYLEQRNQWFFILPLALRDEALQLRGKENYSKLWTAIARLNQRFGASNQGHLEHLITRQRAYLTQYASRFELLPQQTGAFFFLHNKLVGMEIAPSAEFFAELWMPLVCFCYGTAAMYEELHHQASLPNDPPLHAASLAELRQQLHRQREDLLQALTRAITSIPRATFTKKEEERFLEMHLITVTNKYFAGQIVRDHGAIVYASLFARP